MSCKGSSGLVQCLWFEYLLKYPFFAGIAIDLKSKPNPVIPIIDSIILGSSKYPIK